MKPVCLTVGTWTMLMHPPGLLQQQTTSYFVGFSPHESRSPKTCRCDAGN